MPCQKKRNRFEEFHINESLKKLRIHTSHAITHESIRITNTTKENRKKCVLCSATKPVIALRNTHY